MNTDNCCMSLAEMQGFISNLPSVHDKETRRRAAVIHFFTKRLYRDAPFTVGSKLAGNLNAFITMAEGEE